ncbi:hypothetical protein GTO27_02680 [Candidatus Bathyarchaeota archaeon]|nr:hypothetical protein [Candidatus Bathyarchaeota archaeon]
MTSDDWCVVVFKCKPDKVENLLVDLYSFVEDLRGVKNMHFLIRDRVENEVVFSFRVLVEAKDKEAIKSKIAYKLRSFISKNRFAIDPSKRSSFAKYVAWSPEERIAEFGKRKFARFCRLLSQMSRLVVEMAKKNYFDSAERVEMAQCHVMDAWMHRIWPSKHKTHGNWIL